MSAKSHPSDAAWRELRRPFGELLASLSRALFAVDRAGVVTLVEGRPFPQLGLTSANVVGHRATEVFERAPWLLDAVRRALGGEMAVFAAEEVDGALFECRCALLRASDGSPACVMGHVLDASAPGGPELLGSDTRLLLDAVDAIVIKADAQTLRSTFVTPTATRLGYRATQWLAPGFLAQHLHADERESTLAVFRAVAADGRTRKCVHRLIGADGRAFWFRTTITRSGPSAIVAVMLDITESAMAEALLRQSDAQQRLIFEQLPAIVFTLDRDLRFTSGVGAGLKNLGLRPDRTLFGVSIQEYMHIDDPNHPVIERCRQALAGQASAYVLEFRGRLFQTYIEPFRDAAGRIVGALAFAWDVTETKRAQDALRTVADASAMLAESLDLEATLAKVARMAVPRFADASIVFTERDGQGRRLAVAHADPAKEAVMHTVPPEMSLDAMGGVAQTMRTGRAVLLQEVTDEMIAQGEAGPLRVTPADRPFFESFRRLGIESFIGVPLLARGRTLGALVFARAAGRRRYDAEDVGVAEELARRCALAIDNAMLYSEAQDAVAMRDEFLSIASHELRTPLTSALLWQQKLRRSLAQGAPVDLGEKGGLAVAERQTRRLSNLVDQLLDVSRIRLGRLELNVEALDLAEVAREVVERMREESARAGSELALFAPRSVAGQWDRMRIEQLVTNLVSNAIKFGEGKAIEVRVEASGDRARVIVRDHGTGIDPESQRRIFERFERAASSRTYGGLGLGLYISQQIARAHGGSIAVQSAPGQGSTFTVDLPREPPRHVRG